MDQPVVKPIEPEAPQRRFDPLGDLAFRQLAALQAEGEILADGGIDHLIVGILKQETDLAADRPAVLARIQPVERDAAAARQKQAVEETRKAALARAVCADHADAALRQGEIDVGQDRAPAAIEADAAERHHGRTGNLTAGHAPNGSTDRHG